MSAAAPAPTTKAAKAADKMALVDNDDASASESDDTEIGLEEEAPVGGAAADDDSTTSMGEGDDEEEDEEDTEKQAGAVGLGAPTTTATASALGVPDFKTARARKSKTSPAKNKGGAARDEEPELVSGKRRAAAMAHEIIHATSAAGQAEARVASAQARAIAEKKKARKRAASTATKEAAGSEPPAKKARTSSSAGSKKSTTTTTKAKKSGATGSTKTKAAKPSAKTGAAATKKAAKTSAAKGATTKTKSATKTAKKPAGKAASSSSSGSASKTVKKTKASAAPAPKKLPLKDAHTKYRARLAVMPKADFAVLDGAWLSVFDPHLRKRASFPEGHFSPKWTQVLAEVAREKGATIKGVLPHYATTIEGTDNLKAYEKMPHVVDKDRAEAYAAAGFDQVVAARVYVGPAVLAAGVAESPFAFVHADTIDDAFWQSVKKVLDADSSNDDPVDVVAHGSEMEDVEVAA
ncbi:ADK superfamily incomplete domain containing protein [Pandoravirus japonicus]|uniref:ADK superfamily incomplete domain containing protein n=1 Tax=Pandoravirus japonicus TaxID=2823154 RepID=A0A811BNG9_9VIRU|nr:ADK superfamily incomplete domain containing protein [Pandoravirus japonicus]